mgnify:FL=1
MKKLTLFLLTAPVASESSGKSFVIRVDFPTPDAPENVTVDGDDGDDAERT